MKLFEPGRIGSLTTKNRIIMAPMGIGALAEPDGRLSQRAIDYYTERARGGVGLIITGITCVDVEVEKKAEHGLSTFLRVDSPIHINRFAELADAVHDYGGKLCVQLTAGMGRVAYGDILNRLQAVAPSVTPCFWKPEISARSLTTQEVEALVRAFARAAIFLGVAGVDAIQLHGHEGYLFDQFQSALWNNRTDKYGGDLEGRLRFPLEVIETIKSRLGPDFPVIYRYGLVHHLEGGRTLEESLKMAQRFESAGVDALEVDAGCYETWYWAHPPSYQAPGCMIDMAQAAKKVVNIPVIAVGKLGYPHLAEKVLQEGKADFVCLGRALLSDPEWPVKVKEGRYEDIRPCIGDHVGCLSRVFQGKYLSCTVNPAAGMEKAFRIKKTVKPKTVFVIGGGPGGMEAARVAAQRGHEVVLWEKNEQLGGNLIPASVPGFKRDLKDLINYLSVQMRKTGVQVELSNEVGVDHILEAQPDVVIVATGASHIMPDVPGMEECNTCTAVDFLLGHRDVGDRVLVMGGGLVGCETAVYLAQKGKEVTVVEVLKRVCRGENVANRQQILKMLDDTGVRVRTSSRILEVNGRRAVVSNGEQQTRLATDTIVVAAGLVPNTRLCDELRDAVPAVHAIGDCVRPRKIMDAIWEGFRIGRLI